MTEETQALVRYLSNEVEYDDTCDKFQPITGSGDCGYCKQSMGAHHKRSALEKAAAALTALARDLAELQDDFKEYRRLSTENLAGEIEKADALARDLETARLCPYCRQPLVCPVGTAERIAGLEAMHAETLTRAERAEAALAAAVRAARSETWEKVILTGETLAGTDMATVLHALKAGAAREGQ